MSQPDWVRNHIEAYLADPEKGHLWNSPTPNTPGAVTTLLLKTIGRRSGKERTSPLIYQAIDDGFVIIASKGGAPAHPAWYLNLQANPEVKIQVATDHHTAQSETVTDPDRRRRYWEKMVAAFPPYEEYRTKTDREIPVVFLKPIT